MFTSIATMGPKLNRYFAVIALLTLGQDQSISAAIRELTPKVVALTQSFGARKRETERLESDLQKAMERFREVADAYLGNTGQQGSEDASRVASSGSPEPSPSPGRTELPFPRMGLAHLHG
jgi:hypothetical protein